MKSMVLDNKWAAIGVSSTAWSPAMGWEEYGGWRGSRVGGGD